MNYYLVNIPKVLVGCYILNYLIKNNDSIIYSCIYYVSKFQILFKKLFSEKNVVNNSKIEIIINSEVKNTIKPVNYQYLNEINYDFVIYNDNVNRILHFNNIDKFSYNLCNYKFINVDIIFGENDIYTIKLYSEKENYFIENNRINKYVLCYLLKKQHGVYKDHSSVEYKLSIFDNNVQSVFLSEKDEIILRIDDYEIRPIFGKVPFDCLLNILNYMDEEEKVEEEEEKVDEEEEEKEEKVEEYVLEYKNEVKHEYNKEKPEESDELEYEDIKEYE